MLFAISNWLLSEKTVVTKAETMEVNLTRIEQKIFFLQWQKKITGVGPKTKLLEKVGAEQANVFFFFLFFFMCGLEYLRISSVY